VRALPATADDRERARLLARLLLPTVEAARSLLGCRLVRRHGGRAIAVRIVETEAYLGAEDPAAHAFAGRTPRTAPLFGPAGTVYVYLVYGMHFCLNLAVDREGIPGCVLLRAAEPLPGSGLHERSCAGPGRLCRALGIDRSLSGRHLFEDDPPLTLREGAAPERVVVGPRVGIRRAADRTLRFCDAASAAVSRPWPAGVSFGPSTTTSAPPGARRPASPRVRRVGR
jgi:DNA-3-methyladenine glycosylase